MQMKTISCVLHLKSAIYLTFMAVGSSLKIAESGAAKENNTRLMLEKIFFFLSML